MDPHHRGIACCHPFEGSSEKIDREETDTDETAVKNAHLRILNSPYRLGGILLDPLVPLELRARQNGITEARRGSGDTLGFPLLCLKRMEVLGGGKELRPHQPNDSRDEE